MKIKMLLLTSAALWSLVALAADPAADRIQMICVNHSQPNNSSPGPLKTLLEDVQNKYAQAQQRKADPNGFVKALDSIIAQTKFAPLLKCRQDVSSRKGFSFSMSFEDTADGNQNMDIRKDYQQNSDQSSTLAITLDFNLDKSVQRVLFVYIHELTHVCQVFRFNDLYKKVAAAENTITRDEEAAYDASVVEMKMPIPVTTRLKAYDQATGDFVRFYFVQEIEAFYNQQLAYRELIEVSPRLCVGEPGNLSEKPNSPLFEAYESGEQDLRVGTFAQAIPSGYWDNSYDEGRFLYDPPYDPDAHGAWDANGKYRTFNHAMKDAVGSLHLMVNE